MNVKKALDTLKSMKSISLDDHDAKTDMLISKYKSEKDRLAQEIVGVITGSAMPGGSANRIPNKAGLKIQKVLLQRVLLQKHV